MAQDRGSISDEYRHSIDNVLIYLSNVSPYYIFSVLVSFFAVFVVCWYRTVNNSVGDQSQITDKPEEESEEVDQEELKTKTAQFKDSIENLKFPDSLITGEFVHDYLNEPLRDDLDRVSPEDAPGGDGNFKQSRDFKDKKETLSSDDDDDPYSSQPNPMARFKKARQAAIIEKVHGDMSEDQLKEEKEAEASQLAAIWDLLKQQKEQFNIGSEQELQDQLHLYCL